MTDLETTIFDLTLGSAPLLTDVEFNGEDPAGIHVLRKVTRQSIFNLFAAQPGMFLLASLVTATTATGNVTLTDAHYPVQLIDCNGSARDCALPTAATTNHGFMIKNNTTSGSHLLTVKSGATVLATLQPGMSDTFASNGTTWYRVGKNKIITVQLEVFSATDSWSTGDGKKYLPIPELLNGYNLVGVYLDGLTATSSSGTPTIQIANVTDATDMLSTKLTVDTSETTSRTAATAPVIDTTKDDVVTGDLLRIDCDVSGTGTKGGILTMELQLP